MPLRLWHRTKKLFRYSWVLPCLYLQGCRVHPSTNLAGKPIVRCRNYPLTIGKRCSMNLEVFLDPACGAITIGNYCNIGFRTTFTTAHHTLAYPPDSHRPLSRERKDIVLEDHVWIGSHALILPGVIIGKGAVVAAGSVVTCNVPPHTLVAGVPAKIIRELTPDETSNATTATAY